MEEVIRFAAAERLFLLVDEVINAQIEPLVAAWRPSARHAGPPTSLLHTAGVPGQRVRTGQRVHFLQESPV